MLSFSLVLSWAAALIEFFGRGKSIVFIPYGIVIPLVLLVPRILLFWSPRFREGTGVDWLKKVERLIFLILFLNVPGSLYLHDIGLQYDRFLHLVVGFLSALLLFHFVAPAEKLFAPHMRKITTLELAFTILFVGLFFIEGVELFTDYSFGTNEIFGDVAQPLFVDFWEDIMFGFTGIVLGTIYAGRFSDNFLSDQKQ
ncbi:MAG: hypothetical protein AAB897_00055 [Patescibacteria group bacterium]